MDFGDILTFHLWTFFNYSITPSNKKKLSIRHEASTKKCGGGFTSMPVVNTEHPTPSA